MHFYLETFPLSSWKLKRSAGFRRSCSSRSFTRGLSSPRRLTAKLPFSPSGRGSSPSRETLFHARGGKEGYIERVQESRNERENRRRSKWDREDVQMRVGGWEREGVIVFPHHKAFPLRRQTVVSQRWTAARSISNFTSSLDFLINQLCESFPPVSDNHRTILSCHFDLITRLIILLTISQFPTNID